MTNFNENILSKIIARRIIAPEDRANLLPLATPIYCPDANGVKASRVTIIDPNANTLFTSDDFISIGAQFTKGVNNKLVATGTPVVSADGIYTGSTTNYYKIDRTGTTKITLIFKETKAGQTLLTAGDSTIECVQDQTDVIVEIEEFDNEGTIKITQRKNRVFNSTSFVTAPNQNINLIGAFDIDLTQSDIDGVRLYALNITKQPNGVKNTVDIDLTEKLAVKYFIPNEVDLKTDVDLVNFLKSDYAVKFKHAVSTKIHDQIQALVTGNLLPKITMAATLSDALGSAIARIIKDGTGQKYSIYKYNNGAPIEYINRNNQPNIDKVVDTTTNEFDYTSINDVNVPALYYYDQPSLILDNAKFEDYQQGLCSGSIKRYVKETLNVDTTADPMTNIGEGIFGTNDCFAVAFTQPSIQRKPSQDMFGDELYITIYYGVKLINKINLTVFE